MNNENGMAQTIAATAANSTMLLGWMLFIHQAEQKAICITSHHFKLPIQQARAWFAGAKIRFPKLSIDRPEMRFCQIW
jgi:hypothetical protein